MKDLLCIRPIACIGTIACIFISTLLSATDWEQLLPEFETYAAESMQKCNAIGMAIAIVKDGKIVYLNGFGNRGLNDSQPVTPDTLFQIGSMSKSFTAALAAIAIDRRKLHWDDRVIDFLPTFMMKDPWVTRAYLVEDLYAQRSGLVQREGDVQALLGMPMEMMIHNLRLFSSVTSFRSTFAYQNIFPCVGGEVTAKAMNKSWAELMHDEIFTPLGMKSASVDLDSYLKAENRAGWHFRDSDGKVVVLPDNVEFANWVYLYGPAGGVNATVKEMAQWVILQSDNGKYKGDQLISKENMIKMHRPYIYAAKLHDIPQFYCLAWIFQQYSPYPIIWHNGATLGVNNNMAIIPEERLGIVILCNTRNTIVAEALTMKFFDLYFQKVEKIDWTQRYLNEQKEEAKKLQEKKELMAKTMAPLSLEKYVGMYENPVYGQIAVSVKGNDLQIEIGPKKTKWLLKYFNANSFSLYWPFIVNGESKIIFCLDAFGNPQNLIIELLQQENSGVFERIQ